MTDQMLNNSEQLNTESNASVNSKTGLLNNSEKKKYRTNKTADITADEALAFFAEENGIDKSEALTFAAQKYHNMSTAAMLDALIMHTRNYYLNMHGKDRITLGSDGRYKTYLKRPDGTYQLIARRKKKDIENIIINFYRNCEEDHSFQGLLNDFLMDRRKYVRATTIHRDQVTYNRFLKGTDISKKDLADITIKELSDFCAESIIKHGIDKRAYSSLKSLLNSFYDYALENEYVKSNTARAMRPLGRSFFTNNGSFNAGEVNSKFNGVDADELQFDEETLDVKPQVYTIAEQKALIRACLELFSETHNTAYLAIIMAFCLGLRIGELVALKPGDFDLEEMTVSIRRREVTNYNLTTQKETFAVSTTLKNAASYRIIPVSPVCLKILEMVMEHNRSIGSDSGYLFLAKKNSARMNSVSVDRALDYANKRANLTQRTIHSIRKTFLSKLDMSHLFTLEKIRSIAGHSKNSMVLYTNYFHVIDDAVDIKYCEDFEEVADFGMPEELLDMTTEEEIPEENSPKLLYFAEGGNCSHISKVQ